jgi:Pyridoxamine 5'-phosphate oxidase
MSPEECWAMLEASVNGTLVTLRKDGRPIALPVWFVVLDHKIYISTRGKKLTRVRNDKRCAFLVEAGERWAELRAVHVECEGRVIDPSADLTARMAAAMSGKYAAYRTASQAMPAATRQHYNQAVGGIIELEPVGKLLNWDNRRLGVS